MQVFLTVQICILALHCLYELFQISTTYLAHLSMLMASCLHSCHVDVHARLGKGAFSRFRSKQGQIHDLPDYPPALRHIRRLTAAGAVRFDLIVDAIC